MTTTKTRCGIWAAASLLAAFLVFTPSSYALQLIQYDVDLAYSSSHALVVIDIRNSDTRWTYLFSDLYILSTLAEVATGLAVPRNGAGVPPRRQEQIGAARNMADRSA